MVQGKLNEIQTTRTLYQFRNWDRLFETHNTRDRVETAWLRWSNRLDSSIYIDIVSHELGMAHWGLWAGLAMLASKQQPRGHLMRDDGLPQTPESIALELRMPIELVQPGLERFVTMDLLFATQIAVALPVVDTAATKPNGVAKPDPGKAHPDADGGFAVWWPQWVRGTRNNVGESDARAAYQKHVTPERRTAMQECAESYFRSREVANDVVMGAAKWIRENAKDEFKARWTAAKEKKQSADRIEDNLTRMQN